MSLLDLQPIFSTLWVVWFFVLFIGLLVYVMAPRRRGAYERAGEIPMRDDDLRHPARDPS
jgi:cytochrome c oxidase cbb3-type subunit 4